MTEEKERKVIWCGMPWTVQGSSKPYDAIAEETAKSRWANISPAEIQRRYMMAGGFGAASCVVILAQNLLGASPYWRLLTLVPNTGCAAFFNSARAGL